MLAQALAAVPLAAVSLAALLLTGCLPDTAQQVPPEAAAEASQEPPAALSAPPAAQLSATVEVLDARSLPDGLGGMVDAPAPVGLSLSGGWGGRALDPVLVVGERHFTDYDYPAPGVLRYTVPERALLEAGPVWVQWGEDDSLDISATVQQVLQ